MDCQKKLTEDLTLCFHLCLLHAEEAQADSGRGGLAIFCGEIIDHKKKSENDEKLYNPVRYIIFYLIIAMINTTIGYCSDNIDTEVIRDIIYESTLPNNGPVGRPLPLVGHWNVGQLSDGYTPEYQIELIKKGYRILPWFKMPNFYPTNGDYYRKGISFAKKYGLPISFISTQWESLLSLDEYYLNLDDNINQNKKSIINFDKKLNPLSPKQGNYLWSEVGKKWMLSPQMIKLQKIYSDPPLVIFLSNNEHRKEKWYEIEDERFDLVDQNNKITNEIKKQIVGKAWVDKYKILIESMRSNLLSESWRKKSYFIGYNAFGSRMIGKDQDWDKLSININGQELPGAFVWDGTSSSFYTTGGKKHTDYSIRGTLVEAMNYKYLFESALSIKPESWIELSFWDGDQEQRNYYKNLNQIYSPGRYKGMIQYGMWLLRPRLVREFRKYDDTRNSSEEYFYSVLDSVNSVYKCEILRKFWRNGTLLQNTNISYPFQLEVPSHIKKSQKWYLLENDIDGNSFKNINHEIKIFSIALQLGEKPQREWLVYAYSPLIKKIVCNVIINDYQEVKIEASQSGSFYHIKEINSQIVNINN